MELDGDDDDMSLFDEAHLDAAEQRAEYWISKLRHSAPRSSPDANAANAAGPASDQGTQAALGQEQLAAEGGNLQTQNAPEDHQGTSPTQLPYVISHFTLHRPQLTSLQCPNQASSSRRGLGRDF